MVLAQREARAANALLQEEKLRSDALLKRQHEVCVWILGWGNSFQLSGHKYGSFFTIHCLKLLLPLTPSLPLFHSSSPVSPWLRRPQLAPL